MKICKYVSLMMIGLMVMAGVAFAAEPGDYGYANTMKVQPEPVQPTYPTIPPTYPTYPPVQPTYPTVQPTYPTVQPCPQMQPMYPQVQPCSAYQRQQVATEYCTRWIAGHWVQVRVMVPGRWEYRPVWIPGYPTTRYQWVQGFWQTTASNARPDVYIWSSPNGGLWGVPYQTYQNAGGGYFTPEGVWVPNAR